MTTKRNVPPIQITQVTDDTAFGPWSYIDVWGIKQQREYDRRHAARPPWSWSVPYRARPKITAPSTPRPR